ncbi:MAG: putative proline hydroxylase [Chitinophagaceae bacterium]|nr:putative proline hydroxylase [Chitinophagaceae bacterium]
MLSMDKTEQGNPESDFEAIIDSYIKTKVGISDSFLDTVLAGHLKNNIVQLQQQQKLEGASTGNDAGRIQNNQVRGDTIYWLDRKHNDMYENEFFDRMDAFVLYLNNSCYTGITSYEFHYTLYEPGTFYKRHKDQFKNDSSRQFSIINYLNEDWRLEDGGELLIQLPNEEQLIAPTNGKIVFFKSNELEHEVLYTTKNRMSITGWLKK